MATRKASRVGVILAASGPNVEKTTAAPHIGDIELAKIPSTARTLICGIIFLQRVGPVSNHSLPEQTRCQAHVIDRAQPIAHEAGALPRRLSPQPPLKHP